MAITLTAKPSGAVYRYTWTVPLIDGDTIASATLSASGVTIDSYEIDGSDVIFFASGGTTLGTISASVVTGDGETISETLYVPIRASANGLGNTARDVCLYALRPIAGNTEEPTAEELADALEQLNDMLMEWRIDGLDLGLGVLTESANLSVQDEYVLAVKSNLRVRVVQGYGAQPRPVDVALAERGRVLVANRLISFNDLTFPAAFRMDTPMTGIDDL